MAVKSAQLQDLAYVPNYNTLDTNLINTVDSQIQEQGQLARDSQTQLIDTVSENVTDTFQGLQQQDKNYVRDRVKQSAQNIEEGFDQRGARHMLPYIDRETRNLKKDLSIPTAIASKKSQAQERLQENEELPETVRSFLGDSLNSMRIKYDDQGNPIGTEGGLNESQLNIAANWEDWTPAIQQFVNSIKEDSSETGYIDSQTGELTKLPFGVDEGEFAVFRQKLSGVTPSKISAGVAAFLSTNPKYREQLELLGKITVNRLKDREDGGVEVLDDGRIVANLREYVRDQNGKLIKEGEDEFGNPIYKQKVSKKTFNSHAQFAASDIATAYSMQGGQKHSLTDKIVPNSLSGSNTGRNRDQVMNFTSVTGMTIPDQKYTEYFKGIATQEESKRERLNYFQQSIDSTIDELDGVENFDISDDGELLFTVTNENGETQQTNAEGLVTSGLASQQYGNFLKNLEQNLQVEKTNIARLEAEKQSAIDSAFTQLSDHFENENIPDILTVGEDGSLKFKENSTIAKDLSYSSPNNIPTTYGGRQKRLSKIKKQELESSVPYGSNNGTIMELPVQVGSIEDFETVRESFAVKRNEQGDVELAPLTNEFNKYNNRYKEIIQAEVDKRTGAGTTTEYTGIAFYPGNETHENVKEMLNRNLTLLGSEGQGEFMLPNQSTIDPTEFDNGSNYFDPSTYYFTDDGQIMIEGSIKDDTKQPVEDYKRVFFRGQYATNIIKNLYNQDNPDHFRTLAGLNVLRNKLPQAWEADKTMTLNQSDFIQMGLQPSQVSKAEIKMKNRRIDGKNVPMYHVTLKGKEGKILYQGPESKGDNIYRLLTNY